VQILLLPLVDVMGMAGPCWWLVSHGGW